MLDADAFDASISDAADAADASNFRSFSYGIPPRVATAESIEVQACFPCAHGGRAGCACPQVNYTGDPSGCVARVHVM